VRVIDKALFVDVPAGSMNIVPVADCCGLEAVTWKPVVEFTLGA
jgi:hypothetical protein